MLSDVALTIWFDILYRIQLFYTGIIMVKLNQSLVCLNNQEIPGEYHFDWYVRCWKQWQKDELADVLCLGGL